METAHRNNPAVMALEEAVGMPVGSTIRNIGAEHRIATARPQTGLAALREATPWPTVRLVLDNSLAARAATCPAIALVEEVVVVVASATGDRKSTRLNSSHGYISYAVFCLKKKNT